MRLNHVHPDGASTRITYGVLNLARRGDQERAVPLVPGEEVEATLRLDHIAYRLPAGHRLRLAVSTTYWPLIWPAPEAATVTLHEGRLVLPVRPEAAGDECRFPPPEAAPAQPMREVRPESHVRRTETDPQSGRICLVIEDDFGLAENLDHGLISGGVARERWEIHPDDPLSANGRTHWTEELTRGDWTVRTETHAEMWSDAANFHLSARLEAWEGDELILLREVSETVPRDGI